MLIALYITLILGGSSSSLLAYIADIQDNVKTVIVKDERRQEALDTLKVMKQITKARDKQAIKTIKTLVKAFDTHSVSSGEIDAIWLGYFANTDQHNADMLDLRFELKGHINREEWAVIFTEE